MAAVETVGNRGSSDPPSDRRVRTRALSVAQRYLVPRVLVSAYYYWRYRCVVSTKAHVQLSGRISFGAGSVVKPFAVVQTQTGRVRFGRDCAVSSFNHITTGTRDVVVGDHVRLAPHVTILGGSRNFRRKDLLIVEQGASNPGTMIGDDVLIGAQVVVLPGCHIGQGAVVGAGSVVTGEIPPYAIVVGAPARIIGYRA